MKYLVSQDRCLDGRVYLAGWTQAGGGSWTAKQDHAISFRKRDLAVVIARQVEGSVREAA